MLMKILVCIGIPNVFANNIAPAIWLREGKKDRLVFCDFTTASCIRSLVLTWFKRFYFYLEKFDENIVKVFCDKNCFYIKTLDPKKLFFGYGRVEEKQSFFGRIIIPRIDENNRVCELSLIVDKKWLQEKSIFISWDYKMQKFIILK